MKGDLMRLGISLICGAFIGVALTLSGCKGDPTVRAAGEALHLSINEIERSYMLGLEVRMENTDTTIGEFLNERGVNTLTEDEALFIMQTMIEHRETIEALRNFGEEE